MRFPQSNDSKKAGDKQTYPQVWGWIASLLSDRKALIAEAFVAVLGAAASLLGIARGAQYLVDKSLHDPSHIECGAVDYGWKRRCDGAMQFPARNQRQ